MNFGSVGRNKINFKNPQQISNNDQLKHFYLFIAYTAHSYHGTDHKTFDEDVQTVDREQDQQMFWFFKTAIRLTIACMWQIVHYSK